MQMDVKPLVPPELDPAFIPAVLWNRAFCKLAEGSGRAQQLVLALERSNDSVSLFRTKLLPDDDANRALNLKYVERLLKYLLWMKGGRRITIAGNAAIAAELSRIYSPGGKREFDYDIMSGIYGGNLEIASCDPGEAPSEKEPAKALGGHMDGCRIGFDLGGSDRKCAAVMDGEVVHTEEISWDPYFQKDPSWHRAGINDSLKRAAAKLTRVDAIGGSAAGVYVDNKVRIASLFRGVSKEDFKSGVENIFLDLKKEWNDVPFVVVNDGEVTALAGAMSMGDNAVLGISMGTSEAAGYVTSDGNITDWLNELAFAPVDYRDDAPADEWSGDIGCGVQYFSQQAVARLAPAAGLEFSGDMPLPERLIEVQELMKRGDDRAAAIYRTIGSCFGYAVAHYAQFYEIRNLLILGRVTSGEGGQIILRKAGEVLDREFPELASSVTFRTPDEKSKRHGQAVTAASLPSLA